MGLPYSILNINHKKELLRGLWVVFSLHGFVVVRAVSAARNIVSEPKRLKHMPDVNGRSTV